MTKTSERRLMRLLHGELSADEARRLELQLERDGELRAAYRRLARVWNGLELPAVAVPVGFSADVVAAARKPRVPPSGRALDGELSWSRAPAWARAGAASALIVGLLLGATFGATFGGVPFGATSGGAGLGAPDVGGQAVLVSGADVVPFTLAEVYWDSLEESGDLFAGYDALEGVQ